MSNAFPIKVLDFDSSGMIARVALFACVLALSAATLSPDQLDDIAFSALMTETFEMESLAMLDSGKCPVGRVGCPMCCRFRLFQNFIKFSS